MTCPLRSTGITRFVATTRQCAPLRRIGTFGLAVGAACALTTAACGGLRSAPDCRTRRVLLHLSYSYAPPNSGGTRDTRPFADILSLATTNDPNTLAPFKALFFTDDRQAVK